MTILYTEMDCDEYLGEKGDELPTGYSYGDATVRISNPDAENGVEQEPGPLTWLNSARVVADPEEDAVHCVVSVGDPRGGFCFTGRRITDGTLIIHTPHPNEGMPHEDITEIRPGTYQVGSTGRFADEEKEV